MNNTEYAVEGSLGIVRTNPIDESKIQSTTNWFDSCRPMIANSLAHYNKTRDRIETVIEIGSYEGNSTVKLVNMLPNVKNIMCIDTWSGGEEHVAGGIDMHEVERKFDANVALINDLQEVDIDKLRGSSVSKLAMLINTMVWSTNCRPCICRWFTYCAKRIRRLSYVLAIA